MAHLVRFENPSSFRVALYVHVLVQRVEINTAPNKATHRTPAAQKTSLRKDRSRVETK